MSLSIRSLLPLFLVILQCFAPLLHAHAGLRDSHFGLHIPGLEIYSAASGGVIAGQPETGYAATEGCIIAIDDGMREKSNQSVDHPSCGNFPPVPVWIFRSSTESPPPAESSEPPLLLSRLRSPSLSPRAPPVI